MKRRHKEGRNSMTHLHDWDKTGLARFLDFHFLHGHAFGGKGAISLDKVVVRPSRRVPCSADADCLEHTTCTKLLYNTPVHRYIS